MHTFIFQSVLPRYDLRKEVIPGRTDTWFATRYQSAMRPMDIVYFWMGGDESIRGLYGWGHITSSPYVKPGWDSHGVDVEYKVRFNTPFLARELRWDPVLASRLLIFKAPSATNFLIDPPEAKRLGELLAQRGEIVPPGGR